MLEKERQTYATVDEVIAILKRLSEDGKGGYLVGCNSEYWLARKDEQPSVHDASQTVDMGGYC